MSAKVAIREIRCLLHLKSMLDPDIRSKVRALCEEVLENVAADAIDRAWAQYYTADLEIAVLRQSGGLARLWSLNGDEICEQEDEVRLRTARDHLTKAAISHAIGSDILSRIILRNLALVAGPETDCISNASSGSLVLMSIGQSYRQLMIRSLSDANDGTSKRVQDLLDLFSICEKSGIHESGKGVVRLLAHLAEVVPSNWKFVAATLCPSGDLLVTSIEKVPDVGEMRMKTSLIEPKTGDNAYDDILVPLDEIIRESQSQLYGMDVSAVSERFSKEAAKREWWDNRHKLDEDLQALLETVESSHFPSLHLKTDSGDCIFQSAESMSLPIGNLASKFEAAVEETKCREETAESLQKLTVPKLKERLRDEFGFTDSKFRKMKKQDLIDLILSESNARSQQIEDVPSDGCLFLILDENLHRFPFEGMPSLVGHSVCRVPSLSFILASLLERNVSQPGQTHLVDPARASFVLDPESNLVSTRKRLKPVLDGIAIEHDWDWDSAVGQIPNASFFEDGLIRQDGLFMYFGHGGAQTCYSRKQVENLMCERDGHGARACNATVILMGCSSGRLVSVNRKHSQALEQIPLYYEPEGIALSYLCAGAPCVVGNLWDVTDHDIDRYSTTLLEKFLQGDGGKSLASCVATSRSACKLRFIVGCAPVCYGVPVHLQTIN
jgi:separase